jgi:hypothetical protein
MTPDDLKIIKQVERWDLIARTIPTLFLLMAGTLVVTGVLEFQMMFYVGLGLFSVTAICWWWWTIFTIKHLIYTLNTASKTMGEVRSEFRSISREVRSLRDNDEQ